MHTDELHIDDEVVRRLITDQFPQWRDEQVRRMTTDGTVSAVFRIGDALAARFPLRDADPAQMSALIAEASAAMRELAASCPFPTPLPVAQGAPRAGYPMPWAVQTWLPGAIATPDGLARSERFTRDLVHLVQSLRAADTRGRAFAGSGRGGQLTNADEWMQVCFEHSVELLPVDRLRPLWAQLRDLPEAGPDVMTHGDLIPGNLLVAGERLVGVLDGGGFGPADPALDLVVAWHLLDPEMRALLRTELESGDLQWWRGAAWALQQSMGLVWYYRESNPGMSRLGSSTLARILDAFDR